MLGKKRDYLLFFLLATFWGGSFVAIKFVVQAFPPVFGAMLRVGTALLIFFVLFKSTGHKLDVRFGLRWKMWVAGLLAQGIPFCLLFWGERSIAPGLAGIINGTVPLWTFALGMVATNTEKFSGKKLAGLLVGFLGIAIIFSPMLAFKGTRAEMLGTSAVVVMAVSYAAGALVNRHLLSSKVNFRANIYHQHCASLVFLIVASALIETWPQFHSLPNFPVALIAVLYLGLFSTAVAFIIFFHLIREWGAVRATAVTYIAPIFALFWDFVFFKTVPSIYEISGVLAILSGVILIQRAEL